MDPDTAIGRHRRHIMAGHHPVQGMAQDMGKAMGKDILGDVSLDISRKTADPGIPLKAVRRRPHRRPPPHRDLAPPAQAPVSADSYQPVEPAYQFVTQRTSMARG